MVRIVGVQRNASPQGEFILLQNQGNLKVLLKGHILASEAAISSSDLSRGLFAFPDEVYIPPGAFVLLYSGVGEPRWAKTRDNQLLFTTFMNSDSVIWGAREGTFHLMNTQHTFVERPVAVLV